MDELVSRKGFRYHVAEGIPLSCRGRDSAPTGDFDDENILLRGFYFSDARSRPAGDE